MHDVSVYIHDIFYMYVILWLVACYVFILFSNNSSMLFHLKVLWSVLAGEHLTKKSHDKWHNPVMSV